METSSSEAFGIHSVKNTATCFGLSEFFDIRDFSFCFNYRIK